jgi:hypothetical protein
MLRKRVAPLRQILLLVLGEPGCAAGDDQGARTG